ncbi:MAG: hypothetical protein LC627_00835, partial [Verrucomicrobiaceae bacterium]|nr:hypothetical protein [Verrucomicrobiaceae bacterium]
MIYVDSGLAPADVSSGSGAGRGSFARSRHAAVNPLVAQLEAALDDYHFRWGSLPQLQIPAGPALRQGAAGPRVRALRERLGLYDEGPFDAELAEALVAYKSAHGLGATPVADAATLLSLNRGAAYY